MLISRFSSTRLIVVNNRTGVTFLNLELEEITFLYFGKEMPCTRTSFLFSFHYKSLI